MMLRAFDLTWRFSRRLGGNAQHKRATGVLALLPATFFGVHNKRPTATFFGVQHQSAIGYISRGSLATFFAVIGYIFRGTRLRFSGFIRARSATFFGVSTARLNLPSPAPLALTSEFLNGSKTLRGLLRAEHPMRRSNCAAFGYCALSGLQTGSITLQMRSKRRKVRGQKSSDRAIFRRG